MGKRAVRKTVMEALLYLPLRELVVDVALVVALRERSQKHDKPGDW